ncbi:MAG: hypothetical protein OEY19_02890 [Gammaproteobacteria bacterium]|nr:hypothetical protein [Gammaproteobacteria bacterium]MDH5630355.1 hypothetical protein [Gammaproteobacteria bacterium]
MVSLNKIIEKPLSRHFLITLSIIFVIAVATLISHYLVRGVAEEWLNIEINDLKDPDSRQLLFQDDNSVIPELARQRIEEQYTTIRSREKFHLDVTIFFYSRYVTTLTVATVLAILSAVMLLFISKSGWINTNPYIINAFLTISSCATFFSIMPELYEQKINIEENKSLYVKYTKLDHETRSFVATLPVNYSSTKNQELANFIKHTDDSLAKLHILPLSLDPEAINRVDDEVNKVESQTN